MIRTFACPSCGGPLEDKAGSRTVRCSFCSSDVIVPGHFNDRGAASRPTTVSGRHALVVIGIIGGVICLIIVGVAVAMAIFSRRPSVTTTSSTTTSRIDPPRAPGKAEPTGFAPVAMSFGSEGVGPGQFQDARSIALDAQGRIYVGEYSGGRIQVFDNQGQFITQWMVDKKMPLRGLAADRKGTVYVVQHGTISRYDGQSGNKLGDLEYPAGWGFDDAATTAGGGLVAAWHKNRDDIVCLDPAGRTIRTIQAAISTQTDSSELSMRIAADGVGNIYALGVFSVAVFKFTAEGKYVNKFGGSGDGQGQFRAPSAIAVDGKPRVYVADFKGVQVFDAEGRYIGLIRVKGAASGMVFNDAGELFVVARTQVYKYTVPR